MYRIIRMYGRVQPVPGRVGAGAPLTATVLRVRIEAEVRFLAVDGVLTDGRETFDAADLHADTRFIRFTYLLLPPKKITDYKLKNSNCNYVLPQCSLDVFKRSFVNWSIFSL